MIADAKGAVEMLANLDFIDSTKIFVAGYSLGATVGLYAAALDERIAGVVTVAGFTPMRLTLLVIAPVMDKDAIFHDVTYCVEQARKIYNLYGVSVNIQIFSPDDYNRFSDEMREKTYEWLEERLTSAKP